MSEKRKVLIQIDTDVHPSVFDSIVAIDSGVDFLLPFSEVEVDTVTDLVHGAMFTRGPADLRHTVIFVGGSQVALAEKIFDRCSEAFFGPFRTSMMLDPNGSNTTAAAAMLCAGEHIILNGKKVAIFGATGPVGSRLAKLAAIHGADVSICSRSLSRARETQEAIKSEYSNVKTTVIEMHSEKDALEVASGADVLFSAGAAGIPFLSEGWLAKVPNLKVAIDVNAVPPLGLADIDPRDDGFQRGNTVCIGALGVGGKKMKVHKTCIRKLFEANTHCLNTLEIFSIAKDEFDSMRKKI